MEALRQDIQYALRTMLRSPAFTVVSLLILAVGVGANTAIFSVVNGILLRPLPFREPGRLFAVFSSQPRQNLSRIYTSGPDYVDFRDQNHAFEQIADVLPYFSQTLTGEGEPQMLRCTAVSPDFFPMLGVKPLLGRLYRPDEYHIDGEAIVISYGLWQRQFGGDPNVIGRVVHLGDSSQAIIGVMPPLPDLYPETDVWAKLIPDLQFMRWRGNRFLDVIGRLKPGVTKTQAEEDLTTILRRAPETPSEMQVDLVPLKNELIGNARPILSVLMAAVAIVLLIACVNIATLLLARSENRKQEIAVRISLGASRRRLLQQLFTENLLLALAGGTLGIVLASRATAWMVKAGSGQLPRTHDVAIELSVLAFALVVVCLTSLLFGLTPSLALLQTDLNSTLRAGRSNAGNWKKSRRSALIMAEVSLSVILLVAAGLLLRTLSNLVHLDLGFSTDHLLTAHLRLADEGNGTPYQLSFYDRIFTDLPALSGVKAVGVADCLPGLRSEVANLTMADRPADPNHVPAASGCWISADYFLATGTPLLRGRFLTPHDTATAPLVAIINDALARRYWPGQDAIGKRINVSYTGPGRRSDGQPRWREIVGVVGNVKQHGLDESADPAVYLPFYQDETGHDYRSMNLFVRTATDPASMAGTIRTSLRAIEPNLPVAVRTMNEVLEESVGPRHFTFLLLSAFALVATLLAGFGIYGVVAFSVTRRTKEIGIRMALGAGRSRVVAMVIEEVLTPVLLGLAFGAVSAILLSRLAGGILYRTPAADPLVLLSTIAIMIVVGLVAASLPAYRAASTNPVGALRAE